MALLAAAVKRISSMSRSFFLIFRCMSNVPENTDGPKTQSPDQRVTVTHLKQKHKKGEPITMVTAYDYPSAVHLDAADIDICLVSDSAAMVAQGYDRKWLEVCFPIAGDSRLLLPKI